MLRVAGVKDALRGPPFNFQGGGGVQEFLSQTNYLFQAGSASR